VEGQIGDQFSDVDEAGRLAELVRFLNDRHRLKATGENGTFFAGVMRVLASGQKR
jgi:hypothetical protein